MLIFPRSGFSNIGRRLDGYFGVYDKWNSRRESINPTYDAGKPSTGGSKYMMRMHTPGGYSSGIAIDVNRDWVTPYQDIIIHFTTKCQDAALSPGGTATGHTILLGGVGQTTTYQSGSGGNKWVLRIPVQCSADSVLTYSYNQGTGNTTAVDDGQEINAVTGVNINNSLTKRIRFIVKNGSNALVTNETVKLSLHYYNSGTATEKPGDNITRENTSGGIWMRRIMTATPTTDANGLIDIQYTGPTLAVGTTVYAVIYRPNSSPTESMAWTTTIQ